MKIFCALVDCGLIVSPGKSLFREEKIVQNALSKSKRVTLPDSKVRFLKFFLRKLNMMVVKGQLLSIRTAYSMNYFFHSM